MNQKQKIVFMPHYIAPLKHFERILPYFNGQYDFCFLIIDEDNARRSSLIKYCNEKHYEFYVIGRGFQVRGRGLTHDGGMHTPFLSPLLERYRYSRECHFFLEIVKPAKVISVIRWYRHNMVMKEANRLGIETILLFWTGPLQQIAYAGHGACTRINKSGRAERVKRALRKTYATLIDLEMRAADFFDFFSQESRYRLTYAQPKKIGIFDEYEKKMGRLRMYNPEAVTVVGSPDFQILHELKKQIDSDRVFRESLLQKYKLTEKCLKIFVIVYRFYALPPLKKDQMSIVEQVAHYYDVFKNIREVFSETEADVILKMHPGEAMIYNSYIMTNRGRTSCSVCPTSTLATPPQALTIWCSRAVFRRFSLIFQSFNFSTI